MKTMLKRSIDQKLRLRNFVARHWRIETGAVEESRKGGKWPWRRMRYLLPVERKTPVFERRPLQFPARSPRSCAKTRTQCRHTLWALRIRRWKVCREKEVSEAKVILVSFLNNRADIIRKVLARDRLVNIGIRPSGNFTKQKRVGKPGTRVCSRITRLMNNQTKSQKRLLFPHKKRKRRQECCGYCENSTTIGLRLARLGCVGLSRRQTVPVKPMQRVLGSIRKLRFTQSTLRQASVWSLGKIQVKHPHQRSPYALKFENWSHEVERHQRCARIKAWNLAKNMYKLEETKTKLHSTHPRRTGYSRLVNKRAGGKIVCGGFRSWYAFGEYERL